MLNLLDPGRRGLAVPVALLLALPVTAAAHDRAPIGRADAPAVSPPVRGLVTDTTGRAVAGVTVLVVELGRTATTGPDGRFVLTGLPAGTVHLAASRLGFVPARVRVTVPASGEPVDVVLRLRPTIVQLPGVQVSAPAGEGDAGTRATLALDGRALQQRQGPSVAQVLANEPGMAMRFNGPMATMPVIRGLTGERIVLLQDGERTGDLAATAADHLQSVDPALAQRVEVIRGPASLLYGNNAIGGVVNVVSDDIPGARPGAATGWIGGQAESVAPGGVGSAGVTLPLRGGLVATGRASWRRMGDLRAGGGTVLGNTDARTWNGTAGLAWHGARGSLGVALRQQDFDYGVPAPDAEAVRIAGARRGAQLRGELATGVAALPSLRLDATTQRYAHDEVEPDGSIGTRLALTTHTVNLHARTQAGRLRGTVGVQGFFRRYTGTGAETFTPAAANDNVALLAHQELAIGRETADGRRASLSLGARHDWIRLVPRATTDPRFATLDARRLGATSGSLGVSLPLPAATTLSASVARAFRAPTVEELWSNGFHAAVSTFDIGTPTLRPELSTGLDVVLRTQRRGASAQAAGYASRIGGYVIPLVGADTTGDFGTVPVVRFGQVDASLAGAELSGEAAIGRRLVVGAMGDVVRGRIGGGGALPFMPAARIGANARWDAGRWSVGGDVRHVLAQSAVAAGNVPALRNPLDVATGAFTLVNLQATLTLPGRRVAHVLTLRVDNLLDVRYVDATSRIKAFAFNPGRNIALGWRTGF